MEGAVSRVCALWTTRTCYFGTKSMIYCTVHSIWNLCILRPPGFVSSGSYAYSIHTRCMSNTRAILKHNSFHQTRSSPSNHEQSRAKPTLFTPLTPNSPYELDLPSDSLDLSNHPVASISPPATPCPHSDPDPAVFSEFEDGICSMLQESLYRFAGLEITNVGMVRATSNSLNIHLFSPTSPSPTNQYRLRSPPSLPQP